jgi:trans-aconitate methyltransferase
LKADNAAHRPAEPVLSDYDQNSGLVRLARSVLHRHAVAGDVHELVARRFIAKGFARVLDVGCGEGELARYLPDGTWVGLDNSQTMLAPHSPSCRPLRWRGSEGDLAAAQAAREGTLKP